MPPTEILRMFDAAANRATEGLRVVEDYLRFGLDEGHLTSLAKQLRHDLVAALQSTSVASRHRARDTQRDVGTTISTPAEQTRSNLSDLAAANFKRAQQAIRTLEETAKTFDAALAATLEQLRYRVYTLEKAALTTRDSLARLADARLYVLVDGCDDVGRFETLIEQLLAAGVHIIQLRDKRLPDRELLARAHQLRNMTRDTKTLFIVNDRPDIAALARADGVHVGRDELSVKDARTVLGTEALVGVSTHSIEQTRQAVLDGADYIGVGPIFSSTTKNFESFPGLDLARAVSAEIRLSSFAIGGIDASNVQQVVSAGITQIAVSGAITRAANPRTAAEELLTALADQH